METPFLVQEEPSYTQSEGSEIVLWKRVHIEMHLAGKGIDDVLGPDKEPETTNLKSCIGIQQGISLIEILVLLVKLADKGLVGGREEAIHP